MNKKECLEFVISKLREQDEKRTKAKTWEEYNSADCFEECEKICKENGYIKECFYDIWDKAVTKIARENGIHQELPLYTK